LTPADTARLVASQAPAGTRPARRGLRQRCDGNPFFMTEPYGCAPASVKRSRPRSAPRSRPGWSDCRIDRRIWRSLRSWGGSSVPAPCDTRRDPARGDDARLGPAVTGGHIRPNADATGRYGYPLQHVLVREALYDAPPSRRSALHDLVGGLSGTRPRRRGRTGRSLVTERSASHAVSDAHPRQRRRAVRWRCGRPSWPRQARPREAADWFSRALDLGIDTDDERFQLLVFRSVSWAGIPVSPRRRPSNRRGHCGAPGLESQASAVAPDSAM
jgi:hypothetical protein